MTDIHLNFLQPQQVNAWLQQLTTHELDALVLTGDIGEAPNLAIYLTQMADYLQIPLYFVLGNHDYYHSSITQLRSLVSQLHRDHEWLHWLPETDCVQLNATTGLIGHGGWGDGSYGDFMRSPIMLNDYLMIQELSGIGPITRLQRLVALGEEAATHLQDALPNALRQYDHVYVAMHVPPFQESVWHNDRTPPNDDPHLPHFGCKAAGDALLEIAAAATDKQITVLCGHTHGSGEAQIRANLRVVTGGAEYGHPALQHIYTF